MLDTLHRGMLLCRILFLCCLFVSAAPAAQGNNSGPVFANNDFREQQRRLHQDRMSGTPPAILAAQSNKNIVMPTYDEAARKAMAIAEKDAQAIIDRTYHRHGRILHVPDEFNTIQKAIDAARAGDTVLVQAGLYSEQLVMKNGVRLVSDSSDNGDRLVPVKNALLKLPRRTLRTIIDGSETKSSSHGMVDFEPGATRHTVIDGFTIQNLPPQNHHIPGHAHAVNVRGASPIIMNCLIRNNGSTGIGSHVVYNDQDAPMPKRDFRWKNIAYRTSAVIYHNIIRGNLGLGIGSNHFAEPLVLGNEVFNNSDEELGGAPTPGIGNKHGSAATILGNIVHDNPGGGILCKEGSPQGTYHIDRRPHPSIIKNVVYDNGTIRPAISASVCGTRSRPVRIVGNYIYHSGTAGIGLSKSSVAIIDDNMVSNSRLTGIAINGSTALQLNRNKVIGSKGGPGIAIVNGSRVLVMENNASTGNKGPRFVAEKDTFAGNSR